MLTACHSGQLLDFYPRSPCGERPTPPPKGRRQRRISIHALLAESDQTGQFVSIPDYYFYPRSPCGERLIQLTGKRGNALFLSTLSLRRATNSAYGALEGASISIHALLAESD